MVTKTFTDVTPERWLAIKQVFHSDYHIGISTDAGTLDEHGVDISWLLGGDTLTLTITIPHFGWILHHIGIFTEQDALDKFAKLIDGVQ